MVVGILIVIFSLLWGGILIGNFEEEIEGLPWYKAWLLEFVLITGAIFFFVEEMLEIIVDEIIGGEE